MSVCEIKVHPTDNSRMELIIPGEQHFYVKAVNAAERQRWLVALGSSKACLTDTRAKKEKEISETRESLKTKMSELRLYCDLLMQQVHTIQESVLQETKHSSPSIEMKRSISHPGAYSFERKSHQSHMNVTTEVSKPLDDEVDTHSTDRHTADGHAQEVIKGLDVGFYQDPRKPRHSDPSLSLLRPPIRASIDSVKITASSAKSRSVNLSSPADAPQLLDPTTTPNNTQSIQALHRVGADHTTDEPQNQLGKTQRSCLHSAQHLTVPVDRPARISSNLEGIPCTLRMSHS
ncbi:PKHA3 protein, partial [Polypterus senegalus]